MNMDELLERLKETLDFVLTFYSIALFFAVIFFFYLITFFVGIMRGSITSVGLLPLLALLFFIGTIINLISFFSLAYVDHKFLSLSGKRRTEVMRGLAPIAVIFILFNAVPVMIFITKFDYGEEIAAFMFGSNLLFTFFYTNQYIILVPASLFKSEKVKHADTFIGISTIPFMIFILTWFPMAFSLRFENGPFDVVVTAYLSMLFVISVSTTFCGVIWSRVVLRKLKKRYEEKKRMYGMIKNYHTRSSNNFEDRDLR